MNLPFGTTSSVTAEPWAEPWSLPHARTTPKLAGPYLGMSVDVALSLVVECRRAVWK